MAQPENRRSFLRFAIHGLGAIFAAVLGFPAICYLIDPRNRPAPPGDFRLVPGVKASEVQARPVQGVIRSVHADAWSLHPNDVIGRVWICRVGPARVPAEEQDFKVFTTICPHLGCFINLNPDASGFTCPCHHAQFGLNGVKHEEPGTDNPAPRHMDELAFRLEPDPDNAQDRVFAVKFEVFKAGEPTKEVRV
jgi:Rieske Fe-S protein